MSGTFLKRVFRVVQEHQIRLAPKIPDCVLHGPVQPPGSQGVLRPVRGRKVAHLRGQPELRQEITGCPSQDLMGAETEVVRAGVDGGDTKVQCSGQETAFVTRPV